MLKKMKTLMTAALLASAASPREAPAEQLLDHVTARMGTPSPVGHGHRSRPKRSKAYGRKLHRTVKVESAYGRNLRVHFDHKHLTRSERKRFYAGKFI